MTKAIILLSGGIDSATALWFAKRKHKIYALTFKYGNRNKRELKSAKELARKAGVEEHYVVDVSFLREISELSCSTWIRTKMDAMPPTYVPSRNTIFFGVASHFSEIIGARYIISGHSYIDPFPDSKPAYVTALNLSLNYGSWLGRKFKIRIRMPLSLFDKKRIIETAIKLGVPLDLTWSCYGDEEIACGLCGGCKDRLSAFKELGIEDKIPYKAHTH